jgi:hypothetical protein
MAINLNAVSVLSAIAVTPVAPQIEGTAAAVLNATTTNLYATSAYYNFGSSLIGRYGMRCNLAAAINLSGHDFVTFSFYSNRYDVGTGVASVEDGGIRIYFIDGSGNYSGFNLFGMAGSLPRFGLDSVAQLNGFLSHSNPNNHAFCIALNRVPAVVSGTLNWANITAIEVTTKTLTASQKDFHLSRIAKRSAPIVTGTETLASMDAAVIAVVQGTTGDPFLLKSAPMFYGAATQKNFNIRLGLTIGNGATATNFTESYFAIGFENLYEFSPGAASHGPWVQLDAAMTRAFKIIQGSSDVLSLADGSIASAGGWQWELSGSGMANCARVQFWKFNGFRAGHGAYADCTWNNATAPVEVTAATVITGGLIRGATTTALKILGAAGVYANLSLKIDSAAATYDIELGSGGAGAYDLSKVSVPSGYTLRLRNNSATNAITVKLAAGITYSASTAGGTIVVEVQATTMTFTGLPAGCDAVTLAAGSNTILDQQDSLVGTSYAFTYTGTPTVDVGFIKQGFVPRYIRGLTLAASNASIPVSLDADRNFA